MTVSDLARLPLQLHSVLWVSATGCLYALSDSRLSKWEVDERGEQQTLSWDVQRALSESIADAIWVSRRQSRDFGRSLKCLMKKAQLAGLAQNFS